MVIQAPAKRTCTANCYILSVCRYFEEFPKKPKMTWRCRDNDEMTHWLKDKAPLNFDDVDELHGFLVEAQTKFADTRTAAQRRREREPDNIKAIRAALRAETVEAERQRSQRELLQARREFLTEMKTRRATEMLEAGKPLMKPRKLHRLQVMVENEGDRNLICDHDQYGIRRPPTRQPHVLAPPEAKQD